MKSACVILFLLACNAPAASATMAAGPLSKVFQLMDALVAKITKEGEAEEAAYHEFVEWCDDAASDAQNDIKTASSKKEKLEATIKKAVADAEDASVQIEELAKSISKSEKDLKEATGIRNKESAEFKTAEGELMDTVDTMGRAIGVLSKEMAKNAAAFAQLDTTNFDKTVQALTAVMNAAAFEGADKEKIMALVQSGSDSESDDEELGAPAAAAHKSKSGNIVEILEDMKEKAEDQLSELRKVETKAKHNFGMLKQSLDDSIGADNKNMAEEKATAAGAEETKAVSEGELTTTAKDLAAAKEALETATTNCMQTAADHETTMVARAEELKVIAMAKKILQDSNFLQASFLQVSARTRTQTEAARSEVVSMVKNLANEHHSAALAQLASRISAIVKLGGGDDVFAKIKGLITDLIAKLEGEADADAEEKAYCDEQMSKTGAKQEELQDDVESLTTKIEQASSKSAELKEEVSELQAELAKLSKQQAELDKVREDEHAAYSAAKSELEEGLAGVRKALQVLQDYYNNAGAASLLQGGDSMKDMMEQPKMPEKHAKSGGAGQSIISILQVAESDMAKELAAIETEESDSQAEYDKVTQDNKVSKTTMDQDVKYKQKEDKGLEKSISEFDADLESGNTELSAVNEYFGKVKERCVAKPVSYEEQKKRREAEIAGLKEALNILGNEAAFTQRSKRGRKAAFLAANQ